MKINQFAIYRVNNTLEGRKLWRHSMEFVRKRKLQVVIENYHQIYLNQCQKGESLYGIWERAKEEFEVQRKGEPVGVSDVIVLSREGEVSCYYIDKETLVRLSDFIRMKTDGALITVDTTHYKIENHQGEWRVTDNLIYLGKQFYLLENEKYGKNASSVILDAYGRIIVEKAIKFDDKVKEIIRRHMEKASQDKSQLTSKSDRLLLFQKYFENGEYFRTSESGTEQNYNMVDGVVNNQKTKEQRQQTKSQKQQGKKRTSVLLRLHLKQIQVAKKSGKPIPTHLQEIERNRK